MSLSLATIAEAPVEEEPVAAFDVDGDELDEFDLHYDPEMFTLRGGGEIVTRPVTNGWLVEVYGTFEAALYVATLAGLDDLA
jgi:hypothetical protein